MSLQLDLGTLRLDQTLAHPWCGRAHGIEQGEELSSRLRVLEKWIGLKAYRVPLLHSPPYNMNSLRTLGGTPREVKQRKRTSGRRPAPHARPAAGLRASALEVNTPAAVNDLRGKPAIEG